MELRKIVKINGREYPVIINKKKVRRITVRFTGIEFQVTAPKMCLQSTIMKTCEPLFLRLIKRNKSDVYDENNNLKGVYIFGEFQEFKDGFVDVLGEQIYFDNTDEFHKKIIKMMTPTFEKLFREVEVETHSKIHHLFKLVNVKSYFGQNTFKTHLIKININLVHYHTDVIKSVMYHELAHDFVRSHDKNFYAKLEEFDPNYKKYDKILKTQDFKATLL